MRLMLDSGYDLRQAAEEEVWLKQTVRLMKLEFSFYEYLVIMAMSTERWHRQKYALLSFVVPQPVLGYSNLIWEY
mgnify:CR=1 FL=1